MKAEVGSARSWPRALLTAGVIAVLSAGAVFGLGQLHRVTARPAPDARIAGAPTVGTESAGVLVTRDFGASALASGPVADAPGTVMEALQAVARVDTAYGGGFVNAINGVASGYTGGGAEQNDWFYYVNGLLADRGAGEYRLRGGDRVRWDFHRWGGVSAPALVGHYPEPFVRGYDAAGLPTTVYYAEGFAAEADSLVSALRSHGAKAVHAEALVSSMTPPSGSHVMLVGTYPQLEQLAWLADTASHPAAGGLFATFSAGATRAMDARGGFSDLPPAGAVLATARGDAPGAAVWLVTGSTDEDVRRAALVVGQHPDELAGCFGALVPRQGPVVPLPLAVSR